MHDLRPKSRKSSCDSAQNGQTWFLGMSFAQFGTSDKIQHAWMGRKAPNEIYLMTLQKSI